MSFFSVLLWLQFGYSLWQFFRDAKFFRLPYISLNGLLAKRNFRSFDFWRKKEVFFMVNDLFEDINLSLTEVEAQSSISPSSFVKANVIPSGNKYLVSFKGKCRSISRESLGYAHSVLEGGIDLVRIEYDLLSPNIYIFKEISLEDRIEMLDSGKSLMKMDAHCFIDYSSEKVLNKNFLRMISIFPITLQARRMDLASAFLSVMIIVIDLCSPISNKIWMFIKLLFIDIVKLLISVLGVSKRVFLYHFLSTISKRFLYCDTESNSVYTTLCKRIFFSGDFDFNEDCKVGVLEEVLGVFDPRSSGNFKFEVNGRGLLIKYFRSSPIDLSQLTPRERLKNRAEFFIEYEYGSYKGFQEISTKGLERLILNCTEIEKSKTFLCKHAKGRSMHLHNHEMIISNIMGIRNYVVFKSEKRFIVSDWSIENVKDSLAYSYLDKEIGEDERYKLLSFLKQHNKINFGEDPNRMNYLFNVLAKRTAEVKPITVKNSQWKRYCSDLNLIFFMFKSKIRINRCVVKAPSSNLKETIERGVIKTEDIVDLSMHSNVFKIRDYELTLANSIESMGDKKKKKIVGSNRDPVKGNNKRTFKSHRTESIKKTMHREIEISDLLTKKGFPSLHRVELKHENSVTKETEQTPRSYLEALKKKIEMTNSEIKELRIKLMGDRRVIEEKRIAIDKKVETKPEVIKSIKKVKVQVKPSIGLLTEVQKIKKRHDINSLKNKQRGRIEEMIKQEYNKVFENN